MRVVASVSNEYPHDLGILVCSLDLSEGPVSRNRPGAFQSNVTLEPSFPCPKDRGTRDRL